MKMYILEKSFYGAFDIQLSEPIFISANEQTLVAKAAELNIARTKQDLDNEIRFRVNINPIEVI
jgi:hypothetical protein